MKNFSTAIVLVLALAVPGFAGRYFNGISDKIDVPPVSVWTKVNEVVNGTQDYSHPMPYQLDNGELIVGFCTNEDATGHYAYKLVRSTDGGQTWGGKVTVIADPKFDIFEGSFVQLSSGTLLAVYSPAWATGFVYLKQSADRGRTWGRPIAVESTNTNQDSHPSIVRLANGNLIVVYGFGDDIVMRKSTNGGASWSGRTIVARHQNNTLLDPSIVVAPSGALLVAYTDGTNFRINLVSSTNSGKSWSVPVRVPATVQDQYNDANWTKLNDGSLVLWFSSGTDGSNARHAHFLYTRDEAKSWLYEADVYNDGDAHRINGIQLANGSMLVVCTSDDGGDANYHISSLSPPASWPKPNYENLLTWTAWAWVQKTGNTPSDTQYILSKNGAGRVYLYLCGTICSEVGPNEIRAYVGRAGSPVNYSSGNITVDNTWIFVAATFDLGAGGTNVMHLFYGTTPTNLTEVPSYVQRDNGSGDITSDFGGDLIIGSRSTDNNRVMLGDIAKVGIMGRVLTLDELRTLMGNCQPASNSAGFWPLYGTGATEPDLSGNANAGVVFGTNASADPPCGAPAAQAPTGTITSPTSDTTVTAGGSVTFAATGTDPNGLPLSFRWNFGAGSGIPDSTLQNPKPVQFNTAGTFTVKMTVTNSNGVSDPNPPTRNVTVLSSAPGPLPTANWSVLFVDSQETTCGNYAATLSIDGDPSTMWHTQFCGGNPPPPHEVRIDLGQTYKLSGFSYLPRQDGCANGWIKQYEFYVSSDGVNWGTPVASGTFNYGLTSFTCSGMPALSARQVSFSTVQGRYVRVRALSEVNGNPWISAAEIQVIGAL